VATFVTLGKIYFQDENYDDCDDYYFLDDSGKKQYYDKCFFEVVNNNKTCFDEFCRSKECPEFIEWDCGEGICTSCKKIGQSYFINEYPNDCNFLQEIASYENEA